MSRNQMTPSEVKEDSLWGGFAVGIVAVLSLVKILVLEQGHGAVGVVLAVVLGIAFGAAGARVGYLVLCKIWGIRR